MKRDFTKLYCFVDDFIQDLDNRTCAIASYKSKRGPKVCLSRSEVLTILIGFYQSSTDCFKSYYKQIILQDHSEDFKLVSYEHFTKLIGYSLPLLTALCHSLLSKCDGISFVDSTSIAVCKNYRIYSHKVFDGMAARGKTTKGWFYGLKLHLVINTKGELVKASFSSGNKDDRRHFRGMTNGIYGKVFGDRGYISKKLFQDLFGQGIELITRVKRNMSNILMPIVDKVLLLKRALVESVIGRIKLLDKLEHSRHRSYLNAFSGMVARLISYQLLDNKPSIQSLLHTDF